MFGFIKNWFKPKDFKEVKKEYKQIKVTWKAESEAIKGLELLYKVADLKVMVSDYAPDEMVALVTEAFKQNLQSGDLISLLNLCEAKLNDRQQEDLVNRIHQTKEYKEYNANIRLSNLNSDFD